MATDHNFRIKNGLEVGGELIVTSSGQLAVAAVSSQLQFLDNVKAKFGNGSDLQIYHDSSLGHSVITDVGTGNLLIRGTSLNLQDAAGYNYISMEDTGNGGVVKLRHNDVTKLETTSSGVSLTGQLNLTSHVVFNTGSKAIFGGDDTYNAHLQYTDNGSGDHFLSIKTEHNNVITERAKFHAGTGDITFSGDTTFANNLTVTGNLNITGDINSTSVTNLDVVDKTITVANNAGSSSNADGAGIIVDTGGTLPSILWDHANQRFNFSYKAEFAGTPTVNGNTVLTSNAGLNANNINAGTISSARLPTNINADTLDNLNSTEFLRSNTATYYAAGSLGFDLHGGPLASQTMNSHHGLANNGSISDFFMFKHFDVWSKNGSTWTEYGHCDGITDGDYAHQWGGLTLARTNQEYIIEVGSQMGYAFINGLKFQHSTNGNSFAIYFETKESYTNIYESGWTTVASLTGIGSWPGGTTWRLSTAVGSSSYHDNVRLRIVPTWNGGNTNTITLGSLQCFGSYGSVTPGFKVTHDRTMNVINGLQVNGNSVIDSSRNFITNGSLYFQGATNSSFINGSSANIRYSADGKHYFQTYNGGWSTRAEITDDYLSVVDGKELRAYRAGNSAYASLFMDSGEKLYIRNSWGTKDIVMLRTGEVGIGTSSPDGPLHVDGHTSSVATILEGNGNGDTVPLHFRVKANNSNVTNHGIFGNAGSTGADNFIHIGPSSTSGISVMSTGKVGIGTSDPGEKLEVVGNVESEGLKLNVNTSMYTQNASLSYYSSTNAVYLNGPGNNGWLRLNASGTQNDGVAINLFGSAAGNCITFKTNTAEHMRINSAGNVGIGTQNQQRKLTVVEDSAGSAGDNSGILSLTVGTGANTDSKMAFGIDSNHAGWIHVVKPGNNVMPLLLNPTNSDNGRVGIGTNPTSNYKLHVKGPTFIDGTAEAQTPLRVDKDRDGARIGFTYAGNPISSEIGLTYQSVSQQKLWIGANINSTGTGHVGTTQANSNHPSQYIVMDSGGDDITFNRITSGTNSVRYRFQPTLFTMETDDGGDMYIGHDGTYGATGNGRYVTYGLGGRTNGSNRIFAHSGTSDGLYLAAATGHSIMFRPNGEGTNHLTVSTSSVTSTVNIYAPAYVDSDDSAFYADPAGTSRFEQIEFRNGSGIQQPVGNLSDGFMHYRWTSLAAAATQAKRFKIMRLYFCPAHWSGEWQNIDLTLHNVTFQTGSKKYKITAEYNGGYENESIKIDCVEKCGYETERYHVWIDSPVDAGWDHSSQNVYYADVYVDVSHYMQVKPHIQCNDHSFTTTTPTSGGYATLIYTSPSSSNITYSNAGFMAHGNKKHHLDIVNATNTSYGQKLLSFGSAGAGTNSANNNAGAWGSLEGYTDNSGEGSGRLFFREHNSSTASSDSYGMSLGYRGGGTSVRTAAGANWTGLSSIGNGEWGMFGHDGSVAGALIMYGDRAATNINFDSNELRNMSNIKLNDLIYHNGNTAAWAGFDATDRFRINATNTQISSSLLTMNNSRLLFDNNGPGAGNYDIQVGAQGTARAITVAPYATFGTDYSGWSANIGTNTRPKIGTTSSGFELATGFLTGGAALANFAFNQLNWYRWEASELTGMSEGSDLTLGTPKFFVNADQGNHTGSFRAPIFYDRDNTGFYLDPANSGNDATRFRGGALFGPNTSWSEYLSVGGNGRWTTSYATVSSTNGNLHLDAKNGNSIYLAWYNTSAVYVGGDIRATVFYDRDNVAYYGNFAGNSVMNTVDVASLDATGNIQAGGSIIGGTSSSNTDGQNNQPFKIDVDRSSYMMTVAGNTWGLFWAGNSGAKYGSNQGEGADIWANASNPNEFAFVGSDTTGWTVQGHTGRVWQKGDLYVHNYSTAVYDPTTQGTGRGAIHIDPNSATDHAGGAITFGASDTSSGRTAQAGIYIRSDGSYGTRMYLSTTDSYNTGSKTALSIQQNGNIVAERASMYASAFYDNNSTAYFVDPNNSSVAMSARLRNGIAFDREGDTGGAGDFSTFLDASNYPGGGYSSTNQRYWHRLMSKGGTHIVLNTDGGGSAAENSFDHFTVFQGDISSNSNRIWYLTNVGNMHAKGNITAYQTSGMSDIRLKKDIKPLEGSLEKVLSMQGVSFKWKKDDKEAIGFIAQDVEKIVPEIVREVSDIESNVEDNVKYKTLDYGNTVALLVEAIKEQQGIINRLEKEVNDLKNK